LEQLAEFLAATLNTHFGGGKADAKGLSDLFIAKTVHVTEEEGNTESLVHMVEYADYALTKLSGIGRTLHQEGAWQRSPGTFSGVIELHEADAILALEKIQAVVDLDPVEPGTEGGASLKLRHTEISFDKDFLSEILRGEWVASQVAALVDNFAFVAFDQYLESAQVAMGGQTHAMH